MDFPRLLIFSNDGLSRSSSNGRTLANLLTGWPKDKMAQFCVINGDPDFETCGQIFRVTDGQALRALFGKAEGGQMTPSVALPTDAGGRGGLPRNALTMLIRDLVWNTGRWKRCGFDKWIADFAPELVMVQAGDCCFMLDLAMRIAKQYQVPLAVFNTENYSFKEYDYFQGGWMSTVFYGAFHRSLQRSMRRLMEQGACFFYSCDKLTRMYHEMYGRDGLTVYTPASIIRHGQAKTGEFRVSYLGNLELNRHLALIELAETLREIDPTLYLDVYGNAESHVRTAFASCDAIHYHGTVSYETVQQIMADSSLLIHAEANDSFTAKDLETGFSTKIADSLGIGTPLLVYAPETIACAEYVREQGCAFYASNREDLKAQLLAAMDAVQAQAKLDRAYEVALENHNAEKTPLLVRERLCSLIQ